MFEYPPFEIGNVVYTAIGATVFWSKWGRTGLKAYGLSGVIDLFPIDARAKMALEFVVFVILGCAVGIGVANPSNAPQALSAGMGWTGFLTTSRK